VGRVDNVWGDRNLFCSCIPLAELADDGTVALSSASVPAVATAA
jgi:hypothetical protein